MRGIAAAVAGAIFGLGLLVSGMTDTQKVQGWLDFFGAWDPTLAFVFAGALAPMFIAWRVAAKRDASVLGSAIAKPSNVTLDRRLIVGSALFGGGWALSGFCPGPAMASFTFGGTSSLVFIGAMIVGMLGAKFVRI